MNINVVIPPWGSLPVYTHAERWPVARILPKPPRLLASEMAAKAIMERFHNTCDADVALQDARMLADIMRKQGTW